jgi:hypothetical protein
MFFSRDDRERYGAAGKGAPILRKIRLVGNDGDHLANRFRAYLAFRADLPNTRVPTQSSRRLT